MKSRTLTFVTAITLFAALSLPLQLIAQQTTSGANGQIAFTQGDPNSLAAGRAFTRQTVTALTSSKSRSRRTAPHSFSGPTGGHTPLRHKYARIVGPRR
jgi:hypothetical protein